MIENGPEASDIIESIGSSEIKSLEELPSYDGGNFVLYPLPQNVTLETRNSELRRENLPVQFPTAEVRRVNEGERKVGERKGMHLLSAPDFKPRVNIHNIQLAVRDGMPRLEFDIRPTTFAMASDPEILRDPKSADQFSFTGSCIALSTCEEDGSNNMVVGYRLEKNSNYPGMAGAAAAGVPKGELYPQETRTPDQRGRLMPVGNDFFTEGMLDELEEEINLKPEHLVGGRAELVALVWDGRREEALEAGSTGDINELQKKQAKNPHWEFGFEAKFNGTTEDLLRLAAENDETGRGTFDFAEECFVLKRDALRRALTESDSPFPPTHQGLYAGVVIRDITEAYSHDPVQLQRELDNFEKELQSQSERYDQIVTQFYLDNPDKAEAAKSKGYNIDAYDFRVPVVNQGLNDMREWAARPDVDALVTIALNDKQDVSLLLAEESTVQEINTTAERNEKLETRDIAMMFDLDGVLTNPDTKVVNRENVAVIARELQAKKPVAFITGRAYQWVEDIIMPVLHEELGGDESLMNLLFVSCEKGGLTITFEDGQMTKHHIADVAVPENLLNQLRSMIPEGQGVFDDIAKETMFTVEIEGGVDADKVVREKKVLDQLEIDYREILEDTAFEVEVTTIALDVQRKGIDKGIAAKEFVDFLNQKYENGDTKTHPQEYFYLMSGDSPSDGKANEFLAGKFNNALAYVGLKPLDENLPYEVIRPENGETFDKGATAVLKQLNILD